MDVEMVFRDIDANSIVLHLFRASACHSGLSPGYPFGPKEKTRADPTVARPLERSAGSRSDPRHCREGCHPLAAVPSRLSGTKSHKTSGLHHIAAQKVIERGKTACFRVSPGIALNWRKPLSGELQTQFIHQKPWIDEDMRGVREDFIAPAF